MLMEKRRKTPALLLMAALLLHLAACAGTETKTESDPNGPVEPASAAYGYTTEYREVDDSSSNSLNPLLFTEEGVYVGRYEWLGDREMNEEPDDETDGEEPDGVETEEETEEMTDEAPDVEYWGDSSDYSYRYYFIGNDGSLEELDGYAPIVPVNAEGYRDYRAGSSLESLVPAGDGNLLALESVYISYYYGPENLTEESSEYWDYRYYANEYYIRTLRPDLSEIRSVKIDLGEDDYFYAYSILSDGAGNLLMPHNTDVRAYNLEGRLAYEIKTDKYLERLVRLGDGRTGVLTWGEGGDEVLLLDLESHTAGESFPLTSGAFELLPGDEQYDFYYSSGANFYGYDVETQTAEKLLNWINCDVNWTNLRGVSVRPDGTLLCLMSAWNDSYDYVTTELATLRRVPVDSLPNKETLTLGMLYYDSRLANQVIRFNRGSDLYRIEIKDYSDADTEGDYNARLTKLTTEIIAGTVPDILVLEGLPYEQWASRGIFEDLYPYLDKDPELGREDLFGSVLSGLEVNGGLYQISPNFYINTVLGAASVVGNKPGWTYADFERALASMPEGCEPFDSYVTKRDILSYCLSMDMDSFVDWPTGQCHFNSEEFIGLLEFANRFVDEYDWETYVYEDLTDRLTQGKQMLLQTGIYSVEDVLYFDYYFGGEGSAVYIGYPTENGVGNSITLRAGYAVSARCAHKDAAWDFLRVFLTENYQLSSYGLPTNRHAFDRELEEVMLPRYGTNENGETVKEPYTTFYTVTGEVPIYEMSMAQARQLLELVENTDKVMASDSVITNKVLEQAEAYFSGQQDVRRVAESIQSSLFIYINEQK